MIAQGASLKEVADTLGHSTINVTASTYAHLYDDARKALANRMDALFNDESKHG
jgi:integrase